MLVPVIEAIAFLVLLAVAAIPGPVPRAARPLILCLFALLVLANSEPRPDWSSWSFRTPPECQAPPTVTQLLVGAGIVLATNIVTFGRLHRQLD